MSTITTVMPFGKHKGTVVTELTSNYINWLLSNCTLHEDLRMDLEATVANREHAFQRRKALAISLQGSRKHWHSRHECEQYKVRKSNTDVLGNPIN